ncbi:GrpB family protein [Alkalibacillus haloalkaliphilus]|uniref:GrpB family protein n=1 Tax=Alkalibacillus haloalkaliphilus TaxID=94136 RepID=UPI0003010A46|nr:GrpB family protein [Alkalibacillus haloalkaliphilus]
MLGLSKNEVKLVSYNPEWPQLFQQEKQLLQNLIGEHVLGIEHIGSTAIKGLKAKPIIDLVIGLKSLEDVQLLGLKRMSEANYYMLQKQEIEGKIVFAKFPYIKDEDYTKTHFLHVVEYNGDWWNAHIQFRDRLNTDRSLAKEYEALKLNLAKEHPKDVIAYAESKESFIQSVLK